MKRILIGILAFAMCCMCFPVGSAARAENGVSILDENAFAAYALCDFASGQIIASKNGDIVCQNVGLSQMMSLLLFFDALEKGEFKLEEEITISEHAASQTGPQMFLDQGGHYPVKELLKGVIMVSANDACVALCERLAGSTSEFVELMNEKAKLIGMNHTVFTDPTGYFADQECTTANDLARLARELCKYPALFDYTSLWQESIIHNDGRITELVNANRLIKQNAKCDGLAVGSSAPTGYSIAATAKQDDGRFILIGIGANNSKERFKAAGNALDFAFNAYETKIFVKSGQIVKRDFLVPGATQQPSALYAKEDVAVVVKKGEAGLCEKVIELYDNIELPLHPGDSVGRLIITLNGKTIGGTNLLINNDLFEISFGYAFHKVCANWLQMQQEAH